MALNKGYLTAKTDAASDEVYTPEIAVKPLIEYLDDFNDRRFALKPERSRLTIWCPFDELDSFYVKVLSNCGFTVVASHINDGRNFFYWEPETYDIIVSNPPFSIKDDILKRLCELNKPYAMLLPIPTLQGQKRFAYLKNCQVLIFDKRINYYKDKSMKEVQKGVSFGSCYICKDFLPKDLIFKELEK